MSGSRSIIVLDAGSKRTGHSIGCSYDEAASRIDAAELNRRNHVSLPVDWTIDGSGEPRESLIGLRYIVSLRSEP